MMDDALCVHIGWDNATLSVSNYSTDFDRNELCVIISTIFLVLPIEH